jgi:toxin CptA
VHDAPDRWFVRLVRNYGGWIGLWLACLPALWWSLLAVPALRIDVGAWGDHAYLSGINAPEQSSSESYRWSTASSVLTLPNLSSGHRLFQFRAHGWRPDGLITPQLQLSLNNHTPLLVQTQSTMRVYRVVLPEPAETLNWQLQFDSATYQPPGDPRQIGVAIDWIALARIGQPPPGIWQFTGQAVLLAVLLAVVATLRLPHRISAVLGAVVGFSLLLSNLNEPLWIGVVLPVWLIGASALLLAVLWLPRFDRVALALLIAAFGIRLAGAVHPLFNAHDVDVHMRWLDTVLGGQWFLYSTPSEARNRLIFNPPAGYALLLPLDLVVSSRLAVQLGVALFDGLSCLLIWLIAKELRLGRTAGLLALGLFAFLPINMTILWWGFSTNIIAQSLSLLLIWLLLRLLQHPERIFAWGVAVVTLIAVMTHIGATLLLVGVLGTWLGFVMLYRSAFPGWRLALIAVSGALLAVIPIYFTAAASPLLDSNEQSILGSNTTFSPLWKITQRLDILGTAASRAYLPVVWGVGWLGFWLLIKRQHRVMPILLTAWLGTCVILSVVHITTSMLTRYLYFAAPLFCLATGVVLAHFWRSRAGQIVAVALTLIVVSSGIALWFGGVLLRIKPSGLPLSH